MFGARKQSYHQRLLVSSSRLFYDTLWENISKGQTKHLFVINLFAVGRDAAFATEAEVRKDLNQTGVLFLEESKILPR